MSKTESAGRKSNEVLTIISTHHDEVMGAWIWDEEFVTAIGYSSTCACWSSIYEWNFQSEIAANMFAN